MHIFLLHIFLRKSRDKKFKCFVILRKGRSETENVHVLKSVKYSIIFEKFLKKYLLLFQISIIKYLMKMYDEIVQAILL